jgi:thiamine kinase-like enzyme
VEAVGDLSDILKRLQPILGALDGEPVALDGGITNRNYRVTLGAVDYVLRLPGKDTGLLGIDRTAERLANEAAASLGIAPAVAAELDDCLVTHFLTCRALSAHELAEDIESLGRALRSFHDAPLELPVGFRVSELLERYAEIVSERGGTLPALYELAAGAAARIETALLLRHPRPCHNDLLAGNLIHSHEHDRLMIVDWEYAGMGDPRFDLGNLVINNGLDGSVQDRLLSAYYGEPPSEARRAALRLACVLSDAREAGWAVVQGVLSQLDFDFEGYADEHFERLHGTLNQPSFEEWLAVAAS